jgi:hypothetical protein
MNISTFFKLVKAPLKNTRWSWGATREDGSVVLREWQHNVAGGMCHISNPADRGPGNTERLGHITQIRNGAGCYLVICQGNHTDGISSFNKRELWYGEEVVVVGENTYLKLLHRVAVGELI